MIHRQFKQQMLEKGLTQKDFAAAAGVDAKSISYFFNGKHKPNLESLELMAAALDCEIVLMPKAKVTQPQIELLANKNGRDTIFRKAKEEAGELIVAISHFEDSCSTDRLIQSTDIFKEIADIEIMCEQIKVELHGFDAVEEYKAQKIERQLARFGLTGTGK